MNEQVPALVAPQAGMQATITITRKATGLTEEYLLTVLPEESPEAPSTTINKGNE